MDVVLNQLILNSLSSLTKQLDSNSIPSNSNSLIYNLNSSLNQLVQNQLVQRIIEEKLKNQILMNALMLSSQIKQLPSSVEKNISKQNDLKQPLQTEQLKLEDTQMAKSKSCNSTISLSSRKKSIKKIRNQTKNIPKNFGKAIITYIQKNEKIVRRVLSQFPSIEYSKFVLSTLGRRKNINSIADLRNLWLEQFNQYAAPTRILSRIFLNKHSLPYIFNSRISNHQGHIKYRYRLVEALKNPRSFTCIKVY